MAPPAVKAETVSGKQTDTSNRVSDVTQQGSDTFSPFMPAIRCGAAIGPYLGNVTGELGQQLPRPVRMERAMQNYEETTGARVLNWAVIAGAAILLMASLLAVVPVQALHQAPAHTVAASDTSANNG
jgi:hypothetical protein